MESQQPRFSPAQVRLIIAIDKMIYQIAKHWVWLINFVGAVFVSLGIAPPILREIGFDRLADLIFRAFALTCHQLPDHSYFLFGHQLAYCQRDLAIYAGLLIFSLTFPLMRRFVRPIDIRGAVLLSVPMAVDGLSQLFEFRESTWELRTITGMLFALAVSWLIYPRLEDGFAEIATTLEQRFERLAREGRAPKFGSSLGSR